MARIHQPRRNIYTSPFRIGDYFGDHFDSSPTAHASTTPPPRGQYSRKDTPQGGTSVSTIQAGNRSPTYTRSFLSRWKRLRNLPISFSQQPTLARSRHSSVTIDTLESMSTKTVYKVGFWVLSATLIFVGALVIGLLGAGRLSFTSQEKSASERLEMNQGKFFLLTFDDVTNDNSPVSSTISEQQYASEIEMALASSGLPKVSRVEVVSLLQRSPSSITVTALLAFDGTGANVTVSKEAIVKTLQESRDRNQWRNLQINELQGWTYPVPPLRPRTSGQPGVLPQPSSTLTTDGRCERDVIDYCKDIIKYHRVYYPNPLGHESTKEVEAALGLFQMLEYHKCHPTVKNFTCLLLQPPCTTDDNEVMLPCRSYCYDVATSCQYLLNGTYLEDAVSQCNLLPFSNCTQVCLPQHFVCETSRLCLANSSKCNHRFDCGPDDYSDERGCGCGDLDKKQCSSGKCIDKHLFCDNKNDCGDWGDEVNCTCPAGFKRCTITGQCFPERYWCNDEFDCADKSDERNCSCTIADFKCQSGYCLNPNVRCNGINDCDDFSDEFNCDCTEYQFRCDKYLCKNYINTWCNRRPDCEDGTDELVNCTCKEYQYRCDNGQCIPIFEKCDGKPQCDDNSDELHCDCTQNEFRCTNGQCIPREFVCDGKFQCPDGVDERQNCTCGKQTFPCNDGACMPVKWWCDGNKECKEGEDEPENCKETCPPGHPIKCISRRQDTPICVHKLQICNGHVLCKNGEDELGCECDMNVSFTCPGQYNGSVCLPWSKYCNGEQDCPGVSEENGCACDLEHQMSCPMEGNSAKCLSLSQRCDGKVDCLNAVDEVGCTCGEILGNSHPERLCDGVPDCPDFSDELNKICMHCNYTTHYPCISDNACVLRTKLCDGVKDCPAGDDEKYCWKLAEHDEELLRFWELVPNGVLYGSRNGVWAPVCPTEIVDKKVLDAICDHLGYRRVLAFDQVQLKNSTTIHYAKMPSVTGADSMGKLGLPDLFQCPSNHTIHITCDVKSIKCGQRPLASHSSASRIAGGAVSRYGGWPFYAALYYKQELLCGATIIDNEWAITAAHCVVEKAPFPSRHNLTGSNSRRKRRHVRSIGGLWDEYRLKDIDQMVVRAGMIRNSSRAPFNQYRLLDAIIPHSMFNPITGLNDIALLRLHAPLTYSAYVMPICLADRSTPFVSNGQKRACVAVGYGSLGRAHQLMSDVMMEVELSVKDTDQCRRIPTINVDTRIDETQICAGGNDGDAGKDTCQGDSGGPLQCQVCNYDNGANCSWYLFGVTSSGSGTCASAQTPGVYTKVAMYDDWIHATIENHKDVHRVHVCNREHRFTCLLTNCIPEEKVCDHNWDCAFGEDEELCHYV